MVGISNKKIAQGIGWTTVSTIVNGLTQILRLSILARFLDKSDFGIVAILTFILGLTQVFSDLGFSAAIMSEKNLNRGRFLSLFWLQLMAFVGIMIIISLASPLIAKYYNNESLIILVPLMLSELAFAGVGKLYDTVLQKNIQFKTIAIRNIFSSLISLVLAVVLAVVGCGVYSLVFSTLLNAFIVNLWNFLAGQKTYRVQFVRINFHETTDLIKVGSFQMGTQILDYFSSKMDIIIISSFLGMSDLGIYNLAKELVLKFVLVINSIVNKVMLPVLSFSADNRSNLKRVFLSFVNKITIANAPIVGFVFLFSPFIVKFFYGKGYEDANLIVSIMAIWSLFVVLGQPNALIAISTKRTNVSFVYTIFRLLIMTIFLYVFARVSVVVASCAMLVVYFIMFFVGWYILLYKGVNIGLKDYIKAILKPCFIVSIIVGLVRVLQLFKDSQDDIFLLFCMLLYIVIILMVLLYSEKQLCIQFINRLKKYK